MTSWTDVTRLMNALPHTAMRPGRREWRINKKLLGWERPLRKADKSALGSRAPSGSILAVYVPLDVKDMLLASKPEVYFTTPHFDGWPAVLIRLSAISVKELREVLRQSWLDRAPSKLVNEHDETQTLQRSKRVRAG